MLKTRTIRSGLALAITVALVGTLAACSSGDSSGGDDKGLEVWTRSGPEAAASYQPVFDAFTKKTGIKIDYKPILEFDTQLQARAGQKDLPDVLINDAGSLGNYVSQGFLLPIDKSSIEGSDQIADKTWDENRGTDGKYYGVPWSRQAAVTIIRKDWREKLGLPVPKTWDDLSALGEAFATQDPDGDGVADTYGMVVAGSAQSGYALRWAASYLFQAGGGLLKDNGDGTYKSVVNSPEAATAVEWMRKQFCTPGVVVPGSINLTTADTPFFGQGTAGISLTGPYNISTFEANVGADNVEVIPMPAGPGGGVTSLAEGENIYFGASSKKTDLQKQLAEFLITPEAQELAMKVTTNEAGVVSQPVVRIPVNKTVDVAAVTGDPRWTVAADAYNDSENFPYAIDFLPFRQIAADELNAMLSDCNSDIPAGLKKIDDGFVAELKNQNLSQ
ncbi:carbohydrate ABC transporter substrate-binding protein, CUT1 family [Agreia bicolorata]|uniref:Carbohydrate ABC transporter substrate-binding protein, CUT1 family n=1 Tax=Agreia bicolorata TaxID=110935 RepID=A0A1T4XJN8_9MICO|nr:sugar ABC transporter substrate-binding protein [Agreia bicolorata]SKA89388.1 carbohydrate ABC transporter substrate-binding protein, CUT1 family [Agreia bicolorata]